MASFGVFGSYLIIETSQEWQRILWNPWQCKLKLKYMKNPSFGALHSLLPSQSKICKEENQRKKSNNQHFRMVVRNFTHHAKPLKATKGFRTPCEIFLCTDSIRFLSSDILCDFLVSPCNQPRYFLFIFFCIFWEVTSYIRREIEEEIYVVFH